MDRATLFRHACLAAALLASLSSAAAPAPEDEQEVVARPLPTLAAPAPDEPIDESVFDAEAPPPPPLDPDYRAPGD